MVKKYHIQAICLGSMLLTICFLFACRRFSSQVWAYQVAQAYIDTSSSVHTFFADYASKRYGIETQSLFNRGILPYDTATSEVAGPWFTKELEDLYCQLHSCQDSERVLLGRSLYKQELKRFENRQKIPIGYLFTDVADTSSRIVVYYSPVYGDTLFAQIFLINPGYPYDQLRWVRRFTTSMNLVFIFDERKNIEHVLIGKVMYD